MYCQSPFYKISEIGGSRSRQQTLLLQRPLPKVREKMPLEKNFFSIIFVFM